MMKVMNNKNEFIYNYNEESCLLSEDKNSCLLKILYNIFINKKSRWLIYTDKENINFFIYYLSFLSKYNHVNKSFSIKDSDIILLLKDDKKDLGKLLSLECTGIYFNNLFDIKKEVYELAKNRIGRFPKDKSIIGTIFCDGVIQ